MLTLIHGIKSSIQRLKRALFFKITWIMCVLLLTQCTIVGPESHLLSHSNNSSPYTMSSAAYLALAKNQVGEEKQSLLILAAGRAIFDGQWQHGLDILAQTENLTPILLDQKNLLLAKVALIRQQPSSALTILAKIQMYARLNVYNQIQYHEMLAVAYQRSGHPVESVNERIKLDTLLSNEETKTNNHRTLWLTLTQLPIPELETLSAEASNGSILQGWIRLALIARTFNTNLDAMIKHLVGWKATYINHPAQAMLPASLDQNTIHWLATPKHVALLLPLTGPLAGPGNAIKDGYMAASDASRSVHYQTIRAYNTDGNNVATLYQRAIADGADYVVGPLSKADVAIIAPLHHPVPTLLLNDVQNSTAPQAWQFGLSPSNEARQVAVRARNHGYTRALILAPSGAWGDDVVASFTAQWRALGGQVVDKLSYSPHDDLNKSIRQVLHVTDKETRQASSAHVSDAELALPPTRRQDFDMVFLVAYPSQARQIKPLLNYYYAANVPVYATSSVYRGSIDVMKDRDLNGIVFCDMPWVFTHQMGSRNWPESFNSYNRLYALGMDSYALASQLNQLLLFPTFGVSERSGILYLSQPQRISRSLVFGQFQNGVAVISKNS